MVVNECALATLYHANVPRKATKDDGIKPIQSDWFLQAWMKTLKVSQAKLAKDCDWTPSTMHGIYHGRTSYYRDILNLIAGKLNIQPYELLMPPELAMAYRQYRANAETIMKEAPAPDPTQGMDFVQRRNEPTPSKPARRTGTSG